MSVANFRLLPTQRSKLTEAEEEDSTGRRRGRAKKKRERIAGTREEGRNKIPEVVSEIFSRESTSNVKSKFLKFAWVLNCFFSVIPPFIRISDVVILHYGLGLMLKEKRLCFAAWNFPCLASPKNLCQKLKRLANFPYSIHMIIFLQILSFWLWIILEKKNFSYWYKKDAAVLYAYQHKREWRNIENKTPLFSHYERKIVKRYKKKKSSSCMKCLTWIERRKPTFKFHQVECNGRFSFLYENSRVENESIPKWPTVAPFYLILENLHSTLYQETVKQLQILQKKFF